MSKIKCTYEDCFQHFKTEAAMIKHKEKDPDHSFCKRCKVDCADDLQYLIHQICSPKHIACPLCGIEFQSKSGRDSHVELRHPKAQALECVACHEKFTRASALVQHVEGNECPVINAEDFAIQKAEKQIIRDAWESQLDSVANFSTPSEVPPVPVVNALDNMTLLDDEHAYLNQDWQGQSHSGTEQSLQPINNGLYQAPKPPIEAMSRLALNKFPSLPAKPDITNPKTNDATSPRLNDDLLDLSQAESRTHPDANRRCIGNENVARMLFPEIKSPNLNLSPSELARSERMSSFTITDQERTSEAAPNMWSVLSEQTTNRPLSNDPNAPNVHVRSSTRVVPKSVLDPEQYYNEVTEQYECPGTKCHGKYTTTEEFKAHLLSAAHAGGKTQCPSCFNRFRTTWALIAHCESGSRKCQIRKSNNYNQVLRELTAGLLGTDGFLSDGSVRYTANRVQDW